jgi:hypothetical protein
LGAVESSFKAMTIVRNRQGVEMNFRDVERKMNPQLLAELKSLNESEDEQALFEKYATAHVDRFHQSFAPFTGGRS